MKEVFETAASRGIRFNRNKCNFFVGKVKYMGHQVSEKGLKADGSKIEAIKNMRRPRDKTDLQRFLGCITYIGNFIKNVSVITASLRGLLRKDAIFEWLNVLERIFLTLKEMACTSPRLQFF